jgi:hypothetical protein
MHWESDYCWQEVCDEVQWCVECTTCYDGVTDENLDTGDGCDDENSNDPTCYEGDSMWVQNCNGWEGSSGNSVFNILQSSSYDQIRVDGTNLCFSRPKPRRVDIQTCDASDVNQRFNKMDLTKPFLIQYSLNATVSYCMTQLVSRIGSSFFFEKNCKIKVHTHCFNKISLIQISMQHHPKKYEPYFLETCKTAIDTNTEYWDALPA